MLASKVMRAVEGAFVRARAKGKQFPKEWLATFPLSMSKIRICLQADNTVKEVRNTYSFRLLSGMLQAGIWEAAQCSFLRVGHTHEDVDAVFSVVAQSIRSTNYQMLQTPQDLVRVLRAKVAPIWEKQGLHFDVQLVSAAA